MTAFSRLQPSDWKENPFVAIAQDWFLLTAGTLETGFNFMTASWGQVGVLWGKPAVTCYVRHSRHTFSFMEEQDTFSLSFLPQSQRAALAFCGKYSGRDHDKLAETRLQPIAIDGAVTFAQARLALVCKKQFACDLSVAQLPPAIATQFYDHDAVHRMYIGELCAMYERTDAENPLPAI